MTQAPAPIRMVATDLDGTLLGQGSNVSDRTLRALSDARAAGLVIAFVTGRPPRWLAPVVHQTGWHGLAVSANGAVLLNLEKRRVEATYPLPKRDLNEAITTIRNLLPGASFAVEYARPGSAVPVVDPLSTPESPEGEPAFGHEPEYRAHALKMPRMPATAPIDELVSAGEVVKLLARGPRQELADPDSTMHMIATELEGVANVSHSTTETVLLEIARKDISKATGLQALAHHHGINHEQIVAIGDMPNDLPMLKWAGTGLAVANAHPRVLAEVGAANVIGRNTEDAVAALIERILTSNGSISTR